MGVDLQSTLSWKNHIDPIMKKSNSMLWFLVRTLSPPVSKPRQMPISAWSGPDWNTVHLCGTPTRKSVWQQMPIWLQIQGSRVRSLPGLILSWRLIMKYFLRSSSSLPLNLSRRVVVSYKRKYVHEVLVNCLFKNSKWVWSGNTTITNCRQRTMMKQRKGLMTHR